ncbi:hypothetical protein U9M48_029648, partial [Paspalum notatum var. saurae]
KRISWRVEAPPEVMPICIHDYKVATVEKHCTAAAGCSCVSAPYNRAVVVKKCQGPILLEDEPRALPVDRSITVSCPGDGLVSRPGEPDGEGEGISSHLIETTGQTPGVDRYQLSIPSHRLPWQERVGWRGEACPEMMAIWVHNH